MCSRSFTNQYFFIILSQKEMDYRHFIVTRFNLRIDNPAMSRDKSGKEVLTREWLEHRLAHFEKYCLPSVLNQSEKNFRWILYFDTTTEESVRRQNDLLEQKYPDLIKILYADGYGSFLRSYCTDILSLCPDGLSHVITTRLDNDDMIHKDFIKRVQVEFSGQDFTTVNFVKILMLNPEVNDKLYIDYIYSNHFISLIERITPEGIKGCYSRSDRQWKDTAAIQVIERPYCLELISEKNLSNDFRGFPVFRKTNMREFSLDLSAGNKILDIENLKIWKMSWRKYCSYICNNKLGMTGK
jgi:hypothetical protein